MESPCQITSLLKQAASQAAGVNAGLFSFKQIVILSSFVSVLLQVSLESVFGNQLLSNRKVYSTDVSAQSIKEKWRPQLRLVLPTDFGLALYDWDVRILARIKTWNPASSAAL